MFVHFIISFSLVMAAFLGGFIINDITEVLRWFKDEVWPIFILVAGGVYGLYKWWVNTRYSDEAMGSKAKLDQAKSDDDRFEILQRRIDRLASRESANEKRIDALEDQILKFKRFVRQIKLNANEVYEKYKDELH